MITFFTTGKPFRGHDGIIQRNALRSWTLVHPQAEVILFGDDEGAAEVCAELGLHHEPYVARHESGTKFLHYMFRRVNEIARNQLLCFANCDIILMTDFAEAARISQSWEDRFLLVAKRWDTDIVTSLNFHQAHWQDELRQLAQTQGFQQDEYWIDIFLFSKGLYTDMPPLIVGHCYWDNWMIWKALSSGASVVDASPFVTPVHQNHGYNPKFGRKKGVATDALSIYNLGVIGGVRHVRQIDSANLRLERDGRIHFTAGLYTAAVRHAALRVWQTLFYGACLRVWHSILGVTRPVRAALGLRSRAARSRE